MAKKSRNVVIVQMDRGVAVVPQSLWERLRDQERILESIADCATWGEYRALKRHNFDNEVLEAAGLDEFPPDDEPMDVDIRSEDGESGYDLGKSLEMATLDFFEATEDVEIDDGDLETWGPWAWVVHEAEDRVRKALIAAGYTVSLDSM